MRQLRNVIIGAGPAGLQLGYFLARRAEPYLILERAAAPGSFFSVYPRHRKLISVNKVHTGCADRESRLRYDWNSLLSDDERLTFTSYTDDYFPDPDVLIRYLSDFAARFALTIEFDNEVTLVERTAGESGSDGFLVHTKRNGPVRCERLFVGTGLSLPNLPDIEGLDLCEQYGSVSTDPNDFLDRTVIIVGKGNSAFETAEPLIPTTRKMQICGPKTIRLAWGTRYVGDLRAVNNNYLDTYHLKVQNNILDGELRAVRRGQGQQLRAEIYFPARETALEFACDRVILCTGFRFDSSIFAADCRPQLILDGRLPAMTSEWESTSVPGMFFIGTLMQVRDFRKTMSGFIHGFRHNIQALDQMLERRDDGRHWRRLKTMPADPLALAQLVIERVSTAAAVMLQPGFLSDCAGLLPDGRIEYLYDIPADYLYEHLGARYREYYLVTLEYREDELASHDPFALPRGVGVDEDYYIHPVVRRFVGDVMASKAFLRDDLDNDWRHDPVCVAHLARFFQAALGERILA
jgi:thioredoxin reductase